MQSSISLLLNLLFYYLINNSHFKIFVVSEALKKIKPKEV